LADQSPESIWALRPEIVVTAMKDGAVLLDLETKFFYSLNLSGWALAQQFELANSRGEAVAAVTAWEAPLEQVETFIDRLIEEGILSESGEEPMPSNEIFNGAWSEPALEKHKEPLHKVMVSAFDPSLPLSE